MSCAKRWLLAPGHPDYQVSDAGEVRRATRGRGTRPGRLLKQSANWSGYAVVKIDKKTVSVHRLVCLAFVGPQPSPSHEVNHKDLNRMNPAAANLEWATRGENMHHAFENGATVLRGEEKPHHKLTAREVAEIRGSGDTHRALGKRYGVTHGVIGDIKRGTKWASCPSYGGPLTRSATGDCLVCGGPVFGKRSDSRYCADACRKAARNARERAARTSAAPAVLAELRDPVAAPLVDPT